jgi:hypothetical protein
MPSAAAQKYFNSFDSATQQQIRDSWGGSDLMEDWFKNAQAAGAVSPDGTRRGGGGDQGAGVNTGSGAGGMTPQKLRQKARAEGWSEDFQRYSDELLEGWISRSWDPRKGKFRSEHAPPGASGDWVYVEKPTEGIVDPSSGTEWGPHGTRTGVNLSALGLNTLGGSVRTGGGTGGGKGVATPGAPAGPAIDDSYLQNKLVELFERQGGIFGERNTDDYGVRLGGGGIWSAAAPGAAAPPPVTAGPSPSPIVNAMAKAPMFQPPKPQEKRAAPQESIFKPTEPAYTERLGLPVRVNTGPVEQAMSQVPRYKRETQNWWQL